MTLFKQLLMLFETLNTVAQSVPILELVMAQEFLFKFLMLFSGENLAAIYHQQAAMELDLFLNLRMKLHAALSEQSLLSLPSKKILRSCAGVMFPQTQMF
jgi:hypothetical protein